MTSQNANVHPQPTSLASQQPETSPAPTAATLAKLPSASALPSPSRLPGAKPRSRRVKWIIGGGAAVGALGIFLAIYLSPAFRPVRVDLVLHTVRPERLELTVVERGALESADNRDVFCRVKSGAKNSTVSTTIKNVIDDGTVVKKNDLLAELDDSGLQEQLKTEKIALDKAESDKIQAEEEYKITVSQNESDIKSAETVLELARIDLQKYLEGDYPQSLKDVEGKIKVAESDAEQQRDRVAWVQRMVKKGYQTVSQAQAEQSKLESLEITLASQNEAKRVLVDPTFGMKKRSETDYKNKAAEAERALARVKLQAIAKEVKARTDRDTKRSLFDQERTKYHEIEEEIAKCKIYAPQDGMVIYYIPEQARFGGGTQQSIVAQGEPVREGQKLMQIPDLRHMMVNTKVHEAMVARIKAGQKAVVRLDAFPGKIFPAHIESVATISSQQDFWAPDVKVYTTKVALDGVVENLKPGMSAEVKITVGDPLEQVLTVPVEAIIGSYDLGAKRRCYVMTPSGPQLRDILVGINNERVAEIREGLEEGDQVVLNPKTVMGISTKKNSAADSEKEPEEGAGKGKGKSSGGRDKMAGPKTGGVPPTGGGH